MSSCMNRPRREADLGRCKVYHQHPNENTIAYGRIKFIVNMIEISTVGWQFHAMYSVYYRRRVQMSKHSCIIYTVIHIFFLNSKSDRILVPSTMVKTKRRERGSSPNFRVKLHHELQQLIRWGRRDLSKVDGKLIRNIQETTASPRR